MTSTRAPAAPTAAGWQDRVDAVDWDGVRAELDSYGCALTGPLLTAGEAAEVAGLYPTSHGSARPSTCADTASARASTGDFAEPFPDAVVAGKQALFPRLLPIARDCGPGWAESTPWPDTLDEWLDMCHAAGADLARPRSAPLRAG